MNRIKILACRLGLHLWCTPPGPFWIRAYQQHVPDVGALSSGNTRDSLLATGTGPQRGGDAEGR